MPSRRAALLVVLVCALALSQTPPSQKLCQISGVVHRADTLAPLEKATVSLYPQDDTASQQGGRRVVRTGPDGAFAFTAVPAGAYAIEASHNGFVYQYDQASHHFSLRPGETLSNLDITLILAGAISGVLVDRENEPVEGLPVMPLRVRYQAGGRRELSGGSEVVTDDQGRFRLYGLYPGLYYLRTGGPIRRPMISVPLKENPESGLQYVDTWYPEDALSEDGEPLRLGAGANIDDVRISVSPERTFSILGHLDHALNNSKLESIQIQCVKSLPVTLMFGPAGAPVQADGSFKIDGLTPGDYILTAQQFGESGVQDQGYAKVQILDRNIRVNIELHGGGAEVRGRTGTSEQDALPSDLTVYLHSESSIAAYTSAVDSVGRFDIGNIPPGEYRFGFVAPRGQARRFYISKAICGETDYAGHKVMLDAGILLSGCELTLRDDTGVVRGQVMEGDTPRPQITVVLIPRSRDLRSIPRYTLTTKSGEQGRFEIAAAIPGDYFLFAVPSSDGNEEFALSFADRHQGDAVTVQIKANETQIIKVSPLRSKE